MNQQFPSLDSCFMPKKSFSYKRYNVLSAKQNSVKIIDAYVTLLRHLTKYYDYSSFEDEVIRDHVVMSCVSSRLRWRLLWEKNLSLELHQTIARRVELSDQQTSKMESFQQHDDSINAKKRLAIGKKDTSNDINRTWNAFGAKKVDI